MTEPIFDEMHQQQSRGVLLVITGPSGSGKDTVIPQLLLQNPAIIKVTTTSSRPMRIGETEGAPYYFITRSQFEKLIAEEAFFEWVEFRGELYGTQKKTLQDALDKGVDVVWKIEAKGVKNIREKIKQTVPRSVFIFLCAPSLAMMHQRVIKAEGEEGAKTRWNESLVVWEMKQFRDCDYLVTNKDGQLDTTVTTIQGIIEGKRREVLLSSSG